MKCPRCNSEVKKGAIFCTQCGNRLLDDDGKPLFDNSADVKGSADEGSVKVQGEDDCPAGNNSGESIKTEVRGNAGAAAAPLEPEQGKPVEKKKSKALYAVIAAVIVLIAFSVAFLVFFKDKPLKDTFIPKIAHKGEFRNIRMTKYFEKPSNEESDIYYSVKLDLQWPENINGGKVEPLQKAIIDKAFEYAGNDIDEVMTAYFKSYGKEIAQLPEISDSTYDQRYVSISVEKVSYVKDRYISFLISYCETAYGGSIHAADIRERYVNYDIKDSRALSLSDILVDNTPKADILNELKRSLSVDWTDIDRADELPDEVRLTENGLRFTFKNTVNETKHVELNLSNKYISPRIKELFQIKDEYNDTQSEGIEFLRNIYENYVFGRKDFDSIASDVCSEDIQQRMKDEYYYDCEDGDCYAVWLFRTNSQDGPGNSSEVKKIVAKDNGWFDVYYSDMGLEGQTSFKLLKVDGKMLIGEVFLDESYVPHYN